MSPLGLIFCVEKVMKWILSNFICRNTVKKTINTKELFSHYLGEQMVVYRKK